MPCEQSSSWTGLFLGSSKSCVFCYSNDKHTNKISLVELEERSLDLVFFPHLSQSAWIGWAQPRWGHSENQLKSSVGIAAAGSMCWATWRRVEVAVSWSGVWWRKSPLTTGSTNNRTTQRPGELPFVQKMHDLLPRRESGSIWKRGCGLLGKK